MKSQTVSTEEPQLQENQSNVFLDMSNRKNILIIDDDEHASKFLHIRLTKLGFSVTCAADGATGLEEVVRRVPDLLILDLYLPKLSGEEICKSIREHDDEKITAIPIIMLSAKDKVVDKIVGRVLGANAYVTKPFDFEDLLKEIKFLNLLA
ncbi:MAG: response regulator [Candidatus Omnitrophota bacterium]